MPANDYFEVHDESMKELMLELGNSLRESMPKGCGFTLFLFSYGPNGHMFYVSSANRKDMFSAIEEFLAKRGPHD
jgi:hypothetical protein